MPAYLSRYSIDLTLAAGVPQTVDLPIAGARDWRYVLRNTGANALTAMSVARYPLGADEIGEDATAVTTGLPLAAGAALPITGTSEPITTLRVTLTSAGGTTVRLAGGGW
jgi:hypothetical protein